MLDTDTIKTSAVRQMDRVYAQVHAIRDDVNDGEFDGARSHLEILKRQIADLDQKLLAAATDGRL